MATPLTPEDVVPPDLPENTAGIINLLIDAMKLGGYAWRAGFNPGVKWAPPFHRSDLHEIDQLCHRLGIASGAPSWYWLEFVTDRPTLQCIDPGCTQPRYEGGHHCQAHLF